MLNITDATFISVKSLKLYLNTSRIKPVKRSKYSQSDELLTYNFQLVWVSKEFILNRFKDY